MTANTSTVSGKCQHLVRVVQPASFSYDARTRTEGIVQGFYHYFTFTKKAIGKSRIGET